MANPLATGHGILGGWFKRMEDEDKVNKQRAAIMELLGGGVEPAQTDPTKTDPTVAPPTKPTIQTPAALPAHQQTVMDKMRIPTSFDDYAKSFAPQTAPANQGITASGVDANATYRNMMGGGNGATTETIDSNNLTKPFAPPQPAANPTQPLPTAPDPTAVRKGKGAYMDDDFVRGATAKLVKAGIDPTAAMQFASQIHGSRLSAEREKQAATIVPQLRSQMTDAIRSGDRATALSAIIQMSQYGVKVPNELLTWAAPHFQKNNFDLGDREAVGAFNPADGQTRIGMLLSKGQSPDSAARLGLDREKFNYNQSIDNKYGPAGRGTTRNQKDIDLEDDSLEVKTKLKQAQAVVANPNSDQETVDNAMNYIKNYDKKMALRKSLFREHADTVRRARSEGWLDDDIHNFLANQTSVNNTAF
jgi:hypothetical protein